MATLNAKVVGVSGDAVKNLKIFKQANDINFTLLSDINGEIAKSFGVPLREGGIIKRTFEDKEILLRKAFKSSRWTFILDKNGKIIYKDEEVDLNNDSRHIIDFIRNFD